MMVALLGCALAVLLAAPAQAVVDDDPSIAAQGVGDMRVFVRGTDSALWTRSWNGTSWSGWASLGGQLTSGPTAVARPGGIYDVYARGLDSAYYHKFFTPSGGWSAWERLPTGVFTSAPGASYRQGTGEVDVVGVGTDNQLYHGFWAAGQGWAGWTPLGGGLSGRPSSNSPAPGILDVFMRGTDHKLYQKSWTSSYGWGGFVSLGGSLTSGVSATAWDGNRRDIFARGPRNGVFIRSFQAPNWVNWGSLSGGASSAPGATSSGPGRLEVVARTGQSIAIRSYAGGWSSWHSLGYAPLYRAPAPPPPSRGELRLRAGIGCVPRGSRVPVRVNVHKRAGRKKPRVIKVVFFVDRGKHKRTDRRKPYKARIRVAYKAGSKHRVHARIYYRRPGQKRVHRKTVSKRFAMCK